VRLFRAWSGERPDGFGYVIVNNEDLCVGFVSAWGINDPERDATISIMVGSYYQDHGYGSQALTLMLHKLSDELHVSTITASVSAFNLRARHMLAERGFKEVSRAHHAITHDGKSFDSILMRATAHDAVQSLWQDNPYDDTVELIPHRDQFRVQ